MGKYLQMVAVLTGISLISGLALGGLNSLTAEKAKQNVLKFKKIPAVVSICERFQGKLGDQERETLAEQLLNNYREIDIGVKEPLLVFVGNKDGKPYTVAVEQSGEGGYGGKVGVMVGFNIETGNLDGIGITAHNETPGIGSQVEDDSFLLQFVNMSKNSNFALSKTGGDIDAVSGATRSSTAVADGVNKAKQIFDAHRREIMGVVNQ